MSIASELMVPKEMTVMIVDDTKENVRVLQGILGAEGYMLGVALSGEQALEKASKLKPDLILLDVMMPGIDGFETCRRLKQNPDLKDIAVIFLTAKVDVEDAAIGFDAGAVDYITKPFLDKDICMRVRTHLKLQAAMKQLTFLSTKDPLTGLANRRSFLKTLEREYARAERSDDPFSLVFADIDHFKKVNDEYGHAGGDAVLKAIGKFLSGQGRSIDEVCRWGGEEFLIFLPSTELKGAALKAEKIRSEVAKISVPVGALEIKVTMSFGVGTYQKELSLSELIDHADNHLYKAKEAGRNRVMSDLTVEVCG